MPYLLKEPIVIQEYDPAWARIYADEARRLQTVLAPIAERIEHIGSTSVPGLGAKAIIDISVGVRDLDDVTGCIDAMADLGYAEIPIAPHFQRRLFSKGPYNEGTHHVHFTVFGSEIGSDPILFRDYLRTHPDAVARYERAKRDAAAKHRNDLNGYHEEKAPCVIDLMERARAWRNEADA